MDFNSIKLLFNTLKHLKFKQITYRVLYVLRNKLVNKEYSYELKNFTEPLNWPNTIKQSTSYLGYLEFRFLNITHTFEKKIDWNYDKFGKLWTYNLNYFDFLNQPCIEQKEALIMMKDYVARIHELKDGLEPYPISLRGINWIKYMSKEKIKNEVINRYLYNQYLRLLDNLEYHLLGNHLLENGFSLLFGAYYFKDDLLYSKAEKIIKEELEEQILQDGAHFELSPMYHQIILFRILDCIKLIKLNSWKNNYLLDFLEEKASIMTSWLREVTFKSGDIPNVNDSANNIAPTSNDLFNYADQLGIIDKKLILSDSGYRMFSNNKFELFVDVGNVGPSYQPGHVHSDTLSFILHVNNKPFLVDTGISTYEKNKIRQDERSTTSHNTVVIDGQDQTQVWGGFRVAKRAYITKIKEDLDFVEAEHDGYKNLGVKHSRKFIINKTSINISDKIINNSNYNQTAYFHFHPSITKITVDNHSIIVGNNTTIVFTGTNVIIHEKLYDYAEEFNKTKKAIMIKVEFESNLETVIKL